MKAIIVTLRRTLRLAAIAGTCTTLAVAAVPVAAQSEVTTQATLLDRIQIEDFLASYYTELNSKARSDIASHWTADAVFDVNGILIKGRDAIKAMYDKDSGSGGGPPGSRFNMLMTNPVIHVNGDKATADLIFTGIINDTLDATPRLFEQGHEHTEFVKRNGRWLIQRRAIISDGGLPKDFAKTLPPSK